MSQPVTLQQENYRLRIQWNQRPGVPYEATKTAGAGYRAIRRTLTKDLSGQEDFRTPLVTSLPAGGAATVPEAIDTSAGVAGVVWEQKRYARYRGRAEWTWDRVFGAAGANQYLRGGNVFDRHLRGVAQKADNLHSVFTYGDGGGVLARIDPTQTTAIGTTVLQLLLPRTAINFAAAVQNQETGDLEGGDTIEFSIDKGTPGTALAGVKPFSSRIIGTNRQQGTLTLEDPIPNDGFGQPLIVGGDYIYIKGQYSKMLVGHGGWNPIDGSSASLSVPFFGVNRSSQPEELAGLRVLIGRGQDPYPKLSAICEAMSINGSRIDVLFTTPEEWKNITDSLESLARFGGKLEGGAGKMAVPYYEDNKLDMGKDRYGSKIIKGGKITYSYGFPQALMWPGPQGRPIMVMADEYLFNVDGGPEEQNLYRGWNSSEFTLHGTVEGSYVWVNIDGNGPIYQTQDKEIVFANYSIQLISTHENTLNSVVASDAVITA